MTVPTNLAELTVEFFNRAGGNPELSERMAFARTTVHIHFQDPTGETACTVWLDKSPISAELGLVGDAEIELFGTSEVYMSLFAAKEALPIAIVRGDVTYRGPVRKFLRVVPILSSFSFDDFRAAANGTGPVAPVSEQPTTVAPASARPAIWDTSAESAGA